MARLPRLYAPGVVHRVLQRATEGRRLLFEDAEDYGFFVDLLGETARARGLAIHAYVLLPMQFQLLVTPSDSSALPQTMQAIGRRYVPYKNRKTGRLGPLFERRYRSTLIDADGYLLSCMQHLEAQPVAQGFAQSLDQWRWSSYRHHVGREQETFLVDHALYWALRNTPFERQGAYQSLFEAPLAVDFARTVERATEMGWALGDDDFLQSIAPQSTRRAAPMQRGRPKKT